MTSVYFLAQPERTISNDKKDPHGEVSCVDGECSCISEDSVIVDNQGGWLAGTLIGTPGSIEWVDGIFWSSGELKVHTSKGAQLSRYPSFQYSLSIEEQDRALWQGVLDIRDTPTLVFPSEVKPSGAFLSVLKVTSF